MKNLIRLNIKKPRDQVELASSIEQKTAYLLGLVGQEARVSIAFDGYETDPREICEIPEARAWMQGVFYGEPRAIALLDEETLKLAFMCCNDVVRTMKTVGLRGSPAQAQVDVSQKWIDALTVAGLVG